MDRIRVSAVPDVRASAVWIWPLYAGSRRSIHDAGGLRFFSLSSFALDMKISVFLATPVKYPSRSLSSAGIRSQVGGRYGSRSPASFAAAKPSPGAPQMTSARGLFFSPVARATSSPVERRMKLTCTPVFAVYALKIGWDNDSGQAVYTFSV